MAGSISLSRSLSLSPGKNSRRRDRYGERERERERCRDRSGKREIDVFCSLTKLPSQLLVLVPVPAEQTCCFFMHLSPAFSNACWCQRSCMRLNLAAGDLRLVRSVRANHQRAAPATLQARSCRCLLPPRRPAGTHPPPPQAASRCPGARPRSCPAACGSL